MSTQQSWTAWFLGSFASAASPTPTIVHNDDNSQANTPASSSSPYGPYVRTGRGGAGNFTWQSQSPQESLGDNNIEAQNPSSLSERRKAAANTEHLDTDAALKSKKAQRTTSQYVRVGRGYVERNEVQQSPQVESVSTQSPSSSHSANPLVAHPGRGGAGNYAIAAELNNKVENEKQMKENILAKETREKIEEQVQTILPAPPDAWLGGRRRSIDP